MDCFASGCQLTITLGSLSSQPLGGIHGELSPGRASLHGHVGGGVGGGVAGGEGVEVGEDHGFGAVVAEGGLVVAERRRMRGG